jgi:hypothetical protein
MKAFILFSATMVVLHVVAFSVISTYVCCAITILLSFQTFEIFKTEMIVVNKVNRDVGIEEIFKTVTVVA